MTRDNYILAVKAKLDEISPFDEPQSFIAADGDTDYDEVKPIVSYIDSSLDEAAHNCLQTLPISLLHADIVRTEPTLTIENDGVATFSISPATRFVRFRHPDLHRDITTFITSEDPRYLLQQNKTTRSKQYKPLAVISSDMGQMEIYTLDSGSASNEATLLSIDTHTTAENVKSPIEEYIVLECAAIVLNILGDGTSAETLRKEQQSKLQAVMLQ